MISTARPPVLLLPPREQADTLLPGRAHAAALPSFAPEDRPSKQQAEGVRAGLQACTTSSEAHSQPTQRGRHACTFRLLLKRWVAPVQQRCPAKLPGKLARAAIATSSSTSVWASSARALRAPAFPGACTTPGQHDGLGAKRPATGTKAASTTVIKVRCDGADTEEVRCVLLGAAAGCWPPGPTVQEATATMQSRAHAIAALLASAEALPMIRATPSPLLRSACAPL